MDLLAFDCGISCLLDNEGDNIPLRPTLVYGSERRKSLVQSAALCARHSLPVWVGDEEHDLILAALMCAYHYSETNAELLNALYSAGVPTYDFLADYLYHFRREADEMSVALDRTWITRFMPEPVYGVGDYVLTSFDETYRIVGISDVLPASYLVVDAQQQDDNHPKSLPIDLVKALKVTIIKRRA